MRKDLRNFLNGAVYGITLVIPGVSATIFAVILGFYDELIYAMNHFPDDRRKNTRYLAVFLFGIAVGAVAFSSLILYLLEYYSVPTMLFFMGLLIGIIPLVAAKAKVAAKGRAPREFVLAIVAMFSLFLLSRMTASVVNPADNTGATNTVLVLYVLVAGIINGATLVIPGLSGAFLLLVMGLYPLVIGSISSIGELIGHSGNIALLQDVLTVLLPFGIGGIIGCLSMARLMEKLLRDYHEAVYATILGLIAGSVLTLSMDPLVYHSGVTALSLAAGAVTLCAGCALSYIMGKRQ